MYNKIFSKEERFELCNLNEFLHFLNELSGKSIHFLSSVVYDQNMKPKYYKVVYSYKKGEL